MIYNAKNNASPFFAYHNMKMIQNRLRWFEHIHRRSQEPSIKRVDCIIQYREKEERETKWMLEEVIKGDLILNKIPEMMAFNCAEWCCLIHVAYLTQWDKALLLPFFAYHNIKVTIFSLTFFNIYISFGSHNCHNVNKLLEKSFPTKQM